jgi:nucleoid-associated protein YgaU
MAKAKDTGPTKESTSKGMEDLSNENVRKLLEETAQSGNVNIPEEQLSIEEELKPSKSSAILAIIAGILIILAGWSIFNYFSNKDQGSITTDDSASEQTANVQSESDKEKIATLDYQGILPVVEEVLDKTEVKEPKSSIANTPEEKSNIVDSSKDITIVTFNNDTNITDQNTDTNNESSEITKTNSVKTVKSGGTWTANNYSHGDIKGPSYTVVSGDTLWEISEAVYGTGTSWHQIADANNVSYLSNGNPLIIPGQILTIP